MWAAWMAPAALWGQATTTGYQPHARTEAPGALLYASPIPQFGGRVTNILYHRGWLMAGYEQPGSGASNDQRFRVMDIDDLQNNPTPVFRWPSDFGLTYANNQWYWGNWGYHTHGHGRTALSVHWPRLHVDNFGGTVEVDGHHNDRYSYGWNSDVSEINLSGGRHRRAVPWLSADDWAYGADESTWIGLGKRWLNHPAAGYDHPGYYTVKAIGRVEGGRDGVRGFGDQLGDKFFILSDQRRSGVAIYQIPDDRLELHANNPDLDEAEAGGNGNLADIPIMTQIGVNNTQEFGGYWPEFYARDGQLYAVANNSNNLQVLRLTHPTDPALDFTEPVLVRDWTPQVQGVEYSFTNAAYPKFQDNLLLADGLVVNMDKLISGDPEPVDLVLDRPAGRNMSQFSMPLGNLVVSGGYGETTGGFFINVRQQAADTTQPRVAFHIPRDGRTNYSRHMPISVIIHEEIDSETLYNGTHFSLERVVDNVPDGNPVDCLVNFGSNQVLMITPVEPLQADSTYQMTFPEAGGLRDLSGNEIEAYSFRFSTGGGVQVANPAPTITAFSGSAVKTTLAELTDEAMISYSFTAEDSDAMDYRFDPGDGTGYGPWVALGSGEQTANINHTYTSIGRYQARVQVRDTNPTYVTSTRALTIHQPVPAGPRPTESSPIIVASDGRVWAVNPDADTVTVYDPVLATTQEYAVGDDPRSIAEDGNGRLWVTCFDGDELHVLNPADGTLHESIALDYGDAPFGVCPSPDGTRMYVSAYGRGGLYDFSVANTASPTFVALGPTARAIAVTANGAKIFVTRFISSGTTGTVWRVNSGNHAVNPINLHYMASPDGNNSGAGVPNYLAGIAISPFGQYAVVSGVKANVFRGEAFGTHDPNHENSVRAMLCVINVVNDSTRYNGYQDHAAYDLDNSDSPTAVKFTPDGLGLLVAVQGNNQIFGLDMWDLGEDVLATVVAMRKSTSASDGSGGRAPQGIAIDGTTNRIYSQNFMSRSITQFDGSDLLTQDVMRMERLQEINKVAADGLSPEVRLGKEVFYNAMDPRMGAESYMSCASCHVDGGHDGRVWDFTHAGEGLRRTTDLRGRAGTRHGNVHWSGNFDEIQDFEIVMRERFLGQGFLPDGSFVSDPAVVMSGQNADLDALAAYVESLGRSEVPRSPHRTSTGSMTAAAVAGRTHFETLSCNSCHSGEHMTNSANANLVDVGTMNTLSGSRLGGALTGIDVPTLMGLHATTQFGHAGELLSLDDFMRHAGGVVYHASDGVPITGTGHQVLNKVFGGDGGGRRNSADLVGVLQGQLHRFTNGDGVRFTLQNPGAAGAGRLLVRAVVSGGANYDLRINGATTTGISSNAHPMLYMPNAAYQWRTYEVTYAAGENLIELVQVSNQLTVEAIQVVWPDQLALSQGAHGQVFTQLDAGQRAELYAYLLQLDGRDDSGQVVAMPPVETTYDSVRIAHGGYNDASNGPMADSNGNGMINLMEYLLGANPFASSATPPGARMVQAPAGQHSVEFIRRRHATDYFLQIWQSQNLTNWTMADGNAVSLQVNPIDQNTEQVIMSFSTETPSAFYRLSSQPQPQN